MSFRVSFVLVVLAVVLGGYAFLKPGPPAIPPDERPWFYLLDDTKINRLDIEYFGQAQTFVRDETRTWHFGTVAGPVVGESFQGAPFLAAGARSPRIITEEPQPDELGVFGLNDAKIKLGVHVEDGQNWRIIIGQLTPDRINNYAQVEGFAEVYLLDRSWGEFMATMITNPPHATPTPIGGVPPTPTPTPAPTATPVPTPTPEPEASPEPEATAEPEATLGPEPTATP